MPSSTFRFKHFVIEQNNAAMKVGTDGVLIGAWANVQKAKNILDIGTGTGLIALMAAQRNDTAFVTAIEIEELACKQAKENFSKSNFGNRIELIESDLLQWNAARSFDCIIWNPPFYSNYHSCESENLTIAKHIRAVDFILLLNKAASILSENGVINLIVSIDLYINVFAQDNALQIQKICFVQSKPDKPAHRVMLQLVKNKTNITEENLIIEAFGRHQFSEAYITLTKDFYLKF